jgi:hypothetical protein
MTLIAPLEPETVQTLTLRGRLRANRGLIAIGAVVLLVALLTALVQSTRTVGLLDPDATDPTGSHALSVLLTDQGVTVVRVTTAEAAASALGSEQNRTLVIAPTAPLSERMLDRVRDAGAQYTVLLAPDEDTLTAYAPWASVRDLRESTDEVPADCDWFVATKAGPLPQVGLTYASERSSVSSCWGGGIVDSGRGGADAVGGTSSIVTLVGMAQGFTNQHLGESGYASMALGTLGRSRTLVWWLPSTADPLQFDPGTDVGITDLVPSWVGWALLQLVLAVAVVIWWRGRRLGRVVVEPLPVVVRATESVEGRARLYRRGHARESAADAMRTASLARLRTGLALPRTVSADVVVAAVSARTARPATEVAALLTPGGTPGDDASLTGLADALDALENEVRRS